MTNFVKTFLTDESGATAIEYGLIAALVSIAALGTLQTLGTSLDGIFGVAETALTEAAK
ncbi:Flp family type IVb pilin [Kiloniella majae]|uniref:Flp family type IVb pilin n=1 Tax=Kiloniella majae TaxID=1938558 RepID=UPI000A276DB8|nr:Flp family type IVb pilin [Kiloniella majae]